MTAYMNNRGQIVDIRNWEAKRCWTICTNNLHGGFRYSGKYQYLGQARNALKERAERLAWKKIEEVKDV